MFILPNPSLQGVLQCPPPDSDLHQFDARMQMTADSREYISLAAQQLILQGDCTCCLLLILLCFALLFLFVFFLGQIPVKYGLLAARSRATLIFLIRASLADYQGVKLKNTEWVYGVAVYTGNETKVGCNKQVTPSKKTQMDGLIDKVSSLLLS